MAGSYIPFTMHAPPTGPASAAVPASVPVEVFHMPGARSKAEVLCFWAAMAATVTVGGIVWAGLYLAAQSLFGP